MTAAHCKIGGQKETAGLRSYNVPARLPCSWDFHDLTERLHVAEDAADSANMELLRHESRIKSRVAEAERLLAAGDFGAAAQVLSGLRLLATAEQSEEHMSLVEDMCNRITAARAQSP